MSKIINRIRELHKNWQEDRFLKSHGCKSWKEYQVRYDPDCNYEAWTIKSFYYGYPNVYCFEHIMHEVYEFGPPTNGLQVVQTWCDDHCQDKFRLDWHRVSWHNEWRIDELGGGDCIFAAFKSERDYLLFLLRWT